MKSPNDWVEFVKRSQAAGAITIPLGVAQSAGAADASHVSDAELYGKSLERQFREAFPTAAFAGGLGRALGKGSTRGLRQAGTLRDFLQRHEDFEILTTPVDHFLDAAAS